MVSFIPNIISASRALLGPLVYLAITQRNILYVSIITLYALFTDFLDGFIARRLNVHNGWGVIIDPLCDKIFLICLYIGCITTHKYPSIFSILLLKEVCLICVSAILLFRYKVVPESLQATLAGKLGMVSNSLSCIPIILDAFTLPVLIFNLIISAITAVTYLKRLPKVLQNA